MTKYTNQCSHNSSIIRYLLMSSLYLEKVLMLLYGLHLMYKLRHIPSIYNDTFAISFAIINTLFAGFFF